MTDALSNGRLLVRIAVPEHEGERMETAKGQVARALLALIDAGPNGVTASEMSSWALRLAAYIFDLRRVGLDISMERETHVTETGGGWHGRYRLQTPVRIVAVYGGGVNE